ncbi:MAG: universal stress protein [Hyphomicrobiales bacterium]|nr:universal stress protein [Hyphomicrobiales bacterium]
MTYSTLMACLRLGASNVHLLYVVGELAERFGAGVVGVATRQPAQSMFTGHPVPEALLAQDRADFEDECDAVEAEFHSVLATRATALEWRAHMTLGPLARYVANEARCADLVIAQVDRGGVIDHPSTYIDIADLLMQAGRPVLVAPAGAPHITLDRVVVGWKETPETRRAVAAALPLLKVAGSVTLAPLAGAQQPGARRYRLDDVAAWLAHHGVAAETEAHRPHEARGLMQIAIDTGAQVIVAGAFSESRLREWAFGGATHELLKHSGRFALLSH